MRLKPSERLILHRRRSGRTQASMAEYLGMTVGQYGGMERGDRAVPAELLARLGHLGRLTPGERCWVMRHRCGMLQAQVAVELGRSRAWVNAMERGRGPCDELVWYWEA